MEAGQLSLGGAEAAEWGLMRGWSTPDDTYSLFSLSTSLPATYYVGTA